MTLLADPASKIVEKRCPTCFSQCAFCSDYLWMIRESGCIAQFSSNAERKRCARAKLIKKTACPECGSPAGKHGKAFYSVAILGYEVSA